MRMSNGFYKRSNYWLTTHRKHSETEFQCCISDEVIGDRAAFLIQSAANRLIYKPLSIFMALFGTKSSALRWWEILGGSHNINLFLPLTWKRCRIVSRMVWEVEVIWNIIWMSIIGYKVGYGHLMWWLSGGVAALLYSSGIDVNGFFGSRSRSLYAFASTIHSSKELCITYLFADYITHRIPRNGCHRLVNACFGEQYFLIFLI